MCEDEKEETSSWNHVAAPCRRQSWTWRKKGHEDASFFTPLLRLNFLHRMRRRMSRRLFLLLNPFCFCETYYLHFTIRVFDHSAISPFLGGCLGTLFSRIRCRIRWRTRTLGVDWELSACLTWCREIVLDGGAGSNGRGGGGGSIHVGVIFLLPPMSLRPGAAMCRVSASLMYVNAWCRMCIRTPYTHDVSWTKSQIRVEYQQASCMWMQGLLWILSRQRTRQRGELNQQFFCTYSFVENSWVKSFALVDCGFLKPANSINLQIFVSKTTWDFWWVVCVCARHTHMTCHAPRRS